MSKDADIYSKHLGNINGVKFTPREIDIIAFIMSGRPAKKIATYLSLSPKTIENYIHNIIVKLGCNSQDGIREFIEKSAYSNEIKGHYHYLLKRAQFEQDLQKIKTAIESKKYTYLLICDKAQLHTVLIVNMRKYLIQIGIELIIVTSTDHKKLHQYFTVREHQHINCILYFISEHAIELIHKGDHNIKERILYLIKRNTLKPGSVIFFLDESKFFISSTENFQTIEYLNVGETVHSFSVIYETLKRLFPQLPFEHTFPNFDLVPHNHKVFDHSNQTLVTKKTKNNFKNILLFSSLLIILFLIYRHSYEREYLLRNSSENILKWDQAYSHDFDRAISNAKFYQLRGNALNISQAKLVASSMGQQFPKLKSDLKKIRAEITFLHDVVILNPFNWQLKSNIINDLLNQEAELEVALSFNEASEFISEESFGEAVKKLNQIIKILKDRLTSSNVDEEKKEYLKKLIAIAINMKSTAWRKLIEDKEISSNKYKDTHNMIFNELAFSLKNYDEQNFNTYIVMHYIKLVLAGKEKDPIKKINLEKEAEFYLTFSTEKAPKEPMVLAAQALHYTKKKEYDKAIIAFNDFMNIHPDNPAVLHNRAEMFILLGEQENKKEYFHKAYKDAEKANQLKPKDCEIIKLLVWSKLGLKDCIEAYYIYKSIYLPLCIKDRKGWDDVSAVRNDNIKFFKEKFKKQCPNR